MAKLDPPSSERGEERARERESGWESLHQLSPRKRGLKFCEQNAPCVKK